MVHKSHRLQYLQRGYKASEATSQATCFGYWLYFKGFPGWLAWFSLQIFCLSNEIHFSLANANNSASFKRKMVWKWRFSLTHNQQKLVNEATKDLFCKIQPSLGTYQIAGFGGFRPFASLEKNKQRAKKVVSDSLGLVDLPGTGFELWDRGKSQPLCGNFAGTLRGICLLPVWFPCRLRCSIEEFTLCMSIISKYARVQFSNIRPGHHRY